MKTTKYANFASFFWCISFKKKNANEANKLFKYYEEMFFIMDIRNFR